ncbi:MAG TPA: DUF6132 family protein [Ignavibacteria bacterium]|nr:DUF6132 family protein [Ignavibacteria bacterium]HMR40326.1 DUF6132 family protein [Ignavibacteria bacterium]
MTYIGIIIGAVAGFLYWKFIGCESGTCPITSNKYISVTYGAILGSLLFSTFAGASTKSSSFIDKFFKDDSTAKYVNISAEEMKTLTEDSNYVIVDVRTPSELESGYIPGTDVFLDFNKAELEDEIDKLDRSKNYIIYCHSGNRSAKVCKIMSVKGFTNVYNLSGGIMKWNGELKVDK